MGGMTTESASTARLPDHEIPTMSVEELRGTQLARLHATVRAAYAKVPHYREAFDAKGFHPDDLRSLDDVARMPFTSKADLRANYPFGMFAVPRDQVVRVHASSGTTGRPTVVGYTKRDIDTWADLMARSIRARRRPPRRHRPRRLRLRTLHRRARRALRRGAARRTVVPVSGGMTERQVQLIRDFEPRVIMVTPSYFLSLLDEMEREGIDPAATSLQVGIFGAEPWTESMREEIERRTGMDAVDIYGLSEVMGPGVAQEAATTKDGLHIWEDHFYPEVIDPVTEEVLPDGEIGELVLHVVDQGGDAGDPLPHPGPHAPAAGHCRAVDAPDGEDHRSHRRHDDHPRCQRLPDPDRGARARRAAAVALLPVRAHAAGPDGRAHRARRAVGASGSPGRPTTIARTLEHSIKTHIGTTCRVQVREPGSIERSIGKARRIVDERPNV